MKMVMFSYVSLPEGLFFCKFLLLLQDPVAKHFADAFQSLQGVDLATSKADAKGTSLGAKNPWGCHTSIQKIGTSIPSGKLT